MFKWHFLGVLNVKLPIPIENILKKNDKMHGINIFSNPLTVKSNDEKKIKIGRNVHFLVLIYCDSVVIDNILIFTAWFYWKTDQLISTS